ncbi:MAG: DM13 domain-containing protein [Bacteroidetes bacterium]|nr:DM13 domain-containing protein [Bacteroidota bacterium]
MKKLINLSLIVTTLMIGCSKQNGTSTVPGTGMVDTTKAILRFSAPFYNGPYGTVSGEAKIFDDAGRLQLKLAGVNISNGPDLHVYISRELLPANYIDLGRLQSTSGNQVYAIPGNPDFSQYRFVLVHCQRFNHLFGSAELR